MTATDQPDSVAASPRLSVRIGRALRRYFVTGLATLFPVTLTMWLLVKIFQIADAQVGRPFGIPGFGLLVTALVILGVGVFSIHFFGRVVFRTLEAFFGRLPIVKSVYPLVKQFGDSLFGGKDNPKAAFRYVVFVEYPRLGCYSIAFVTNECQTTVLGQPRTILTLIIPTPPSPFTGPIIFVPKEDVIWLSMSVEEGLKLAFSVGVVAPPLQAIPRSTIAPS